MVCKIEPSFRVYSAGDFCWEVIVNPDHGEGVLIRYYNRTTDKSPAEELNLDVDAIDDMIEVLEFMKKSIKENL